MIPVWSAFRLQCMAEPGSSYSFPSTWRSSPGLSPRHSRRRCGFINASHRPFALPIFASDRRKCQAQTSISPGSVRLVFFWEPRKWMKTSEAIMFCDITHFKCSSFSAAPRIRQRLMAGPGGLNCQTGAGGCVLVALPLPQTWSFVLFGWGKSHNVEHNVMFSLSVEILFH